MSEIRRSDYSGVIRRSLILRRFQDDDGDDGVLGARNKLRQESRRDSIDFEMIRASQRRRIRYIREIAELVVDGTPKVHRALEPGLQESTYWLPREWRPPFDPRRREAHGQSVLNGLVVFLGGPGVFAVNLWPGSNLAFFG